MKGKWLILLLAVTILGTAAAIWRPAPRETPPPSATTTANGTDKTSAPDNESPAQAESAARFAARLAEAKHAWQTDNDPVKAERLLQEALTMAHTDEQRFAAFAWRAELFDGRDNARQLAAGRAMRAIAHTPREQAAAGHIIARASEKMGDYRAAVTEYETAAGQYQKSGQPDMARLNYAAAARLAMDKLHNGERGNALWKNAWQAVESAGMSDTDRAAAFYDLCLDQASFAAARKEYVEELRWHREAARWQPSHAASVTALEEAYRRQRKL